MMMCRKRALELGKEIFYFSVDLLILNHQKFVVYCYCIRNRKIEFMTITWAMCCLSTVDIPNSWHFFFNKNKRIAQFLLLVYILFVFMQSIKSLKFKGIAIVLPSRSYLVFRLAPRFFSAIWNINNKTNVRWRQKLTFQNFWTKFSKAVNLWRWVLSFTHRNKFFTVDRSFVSWCIYWIGFFRQKWINNKSICKKNSNEEWKNVCFFF